MIKLLVEWWRSLWRNPLEDIHSVELGRMWMRGEIRPDDYFAEIRRRAGRG